MILGQGTHFRRTTVWQMSGALFSLSWNGTEPAWLKRWRIQSGASGFRKSQPGRSGQEARGWGALIPPPLFPPEDPQADSSISPLPHLESKIQQTHSLARLLTKYAEQLLQEYVQHQGDPFGLPGFSPPRLPVADLSAPAPGHAGLPVPERLRLDEAALAALPPLLDVVRRRQAELNPRALRLLRRLEDAARQARALGAAVEAVLAALGAETRGPRPEPAAAAIAAATVTAGVFPAKVLGLRVCGLYREWVSRTEADLGQLAPGGPA
ncbi:cardiotrophin-1 isoform X1 [Delphinus delphis]|uniref:Cardiotrophin-1 n=1 Tax=Tursiops truncatus TaxID=9739 RepID=A0A2U4A8J4_TURTR|nr:cardiotrophin-1 isoform X1 [Tursiops truncatus]XP_059888088.1 cardiotrophin-1 isoform X1 [Delphinus delphis]